MLTGRGWWFLLIVGGTLALGVLGGHAVLALLGLTLLLWLLGEWFLFLVRSRIIVRSVRVRRALGTGQTAALWAGQTFPVRVEVVLEQPLGVPYVAVADWVPLGVEHVAGAAQAGGALRAGEPLVLDYQLRCPAAGRVRFEGVRLQLADLQGFFFHATFVPAAAEYRVLPAPVDTVGQPATTKRHNLLPPPGIHRLRRPGTGSELLDLRDYLPGDPPRTIAWKVSARRDRLITKEFESEVPVRCTLFLDTSNSVRLGAAGANALAGLLDTAAAIAQVNAAHRDLTGLCLFDERRVEIVRPARGSRHLAQLIRRLADAADLAPTAGKAPVGPLMQLAYPLAQEVYPYLMRPEVNRVPFWLPWLWPVPAASGRPSLFRHLYRVLFVLVAVLSTAASLFFYYLFIDLAGERGLPLPSPLLIDLSAVAGVLAAIPLWRRAYRALPLLFSFRRRRLARWRKRLAALLALRFGLGPGGVALLMEDDEQFALQLQRFLAEHRVPYSLPLYDGAGRYLFACPDKLDVLARALLQAVGRGHDNELFVLLVDLLELPDRLDVLLRAVRVALARHHQVVVLCPWPPGLPLPGAQQAEQEAGRPGEKGTPAPRGRPPVQRFSISHLLKRASAARFRQAFGQLRRTFARLGVPVVWAAGEEPVQLVLERMDRLRGLGRRR
jgi:uncharacterized protein (DUF58 family)